MKKYTIKDIALLAGVSKGTVDRVIHNRGNVAKDVEEKVKQLLEEINYQPNLIARNLKNNKVFYIGVLIPDPKIDAYWAVCIDGINSALSEFSAFDVQINTFLFDPTDTDDFLACNDTMLKTAPDVILMVPLFYKEATSVLKHYESLNIPVGTFNNQIISSSANFIGQDLYQSGRIAAKLLHSISNKGDMAIVHIDEKYKNAVHMQEKEKGFKSYYDDMDLFEDSVLTCKIKYFETEDKLRDFLNNHPHIEGIFVTNSKAFHVARLLESENKTHIKLVGYDLLSDNVNYLNSGTIDFLIHQNPRQQAYLGLKYLIEYLVFDKQIPEKFLLPIDIINSENVTPFLRP
ncbi:LacI family DNA-binding transcriptional regulator [Gelidibacter salicanalis]|uniref:LacI family DNA-binding transcriptional regulator n=1 Tax=Gelidibacter salicanalis TaxID=291193 RepID=A0A934KQN1_9FLAO|nr:LacI family DNA-binding transcriptional regulator [Gelidibacter salicanalis]MBJ7882049.1 LacI family DNA-binding transcriptional regulator [Gelidibacter salicanalis]